MQIHKLLFLLLALWIAAFSLTFRNLRAQSLPLQIKSINFEGNQSMDARQLKRLLRMSREGDEYIPENLLADLRQVDSAYRDSGFLKVKVGPPDLQVRVDSGVKVAAIRIPVTEGPQYVVEKIAVQNTDVLDSASIGLMSPLQKGQPYSRTKIAQWQAKVEDAYRSMGYMRARCTATEALNETARTVDCILSCVEGKLYSVGKITIDGNGALPPEIKRRLMFSEGGIFNPDTLYLSIQYLNQMRLYKPISNSDIRINIDDEKGTVDLSLRVVPLEP